MDKQLIAFKKFYKEHPHSKAANIYSDDICYLAEKACGDMVKFALYCFELGFMRGMHSKEYYLRKDGRLS